MLFNVTSMSRTRAGVCVTGSLGETPLSVFHDQLAVNFLGAVSVTKGEHSVLGIAHCHARQSDAASASCVMAVCVAVGVAGTS